MKVISNDRRETIRRAARAVVQLSVCPDAARDARMQNGIVNAVEVFTDREAWDAVHVLEGMVHQHGLDETPTGNPVLDPAALYIAYDRLVCGRTRCAGNCAVYTGRTTGGVPLARFTDEDAAAWQYQGGGPATCDCGAVTHAWGSAS